MEARATYLSEMHSQLRTVNIELEYLEKEIESLLMRQQELLDRKSLIEEQIQEEDIGPLMPSSQTPMNNTQTQEAIDWGSSAFSWTQNVENALENVFHIQQFRNLQRETINATLSGMDCLLIMPTGGGKSLCYQLPAIVSDGFTLVVSPLVSLMEDQILALHDLEVNATLLNANSTRDHVNHTHNQMTDKNSLIKLIYVTPEKIAKSKRFMTKLEKAYEAQLLSRIVIDEVHCTSQWGHDFRPDYKYLNILKRQFPKTPILGLTATATSKVLIDIKKILNLQKGCLVFRASFNRPNLLYEVIINSSTQSSTVDDIAEIINTRFKGQSGIVYCFSRKDSETVAAELKKRGIKSGCYHADLPQNSRSQVHYGWLKNKIQVVVATVAFGMGIDKPNVRFVIHYSISKSMENFYQESGRAGRDDNQSSCILFFKFSDAFRQSTMVFTEQTGLPNLYGMLEYCLDMRTCRRQLIGKHFEEHWDPAQCNSMCDNCKRRKNNATFVEKDVTESALDVLKIVKNASDLKERITALKLIDAWLGKGSVNLRVSSVKEPRYCRATCERIVLHMLVKEVLREEFHFTPYSTISYIVEGPRARILRNKQIKIHVHIEDTRRKTEQEAPKTLASYAIDESIVDVEKDTQKNSKVTKVKSAKSIKRKNVKSKSRETVSPTPKRRIKSKIKTTNSAKPKTNKRIILDDDCLSDEDLACIIADELATEDLLLIDEPALTPDSGCNSNAHLNTFVGKEPTLKEISQTKSREEEAISSTLGQDICDWNQPSSETRIGKDSIVNFQTDSKTISPAKSPPSDTNTAQITPSPNSKFKFRRTSAIAALSSS